jgi:TerC family integral membrane protein
MGERKRSLSQSLLYTACYSGLAFLFGVGLYIYGGKQKALEFAAAYLVEQSLSVDNLFVFLITFKYFLVPPELQPRVLTWGIIGAVLMRGVMIVAGVSAVQRFKSIILIFAAILLVSAVKLFFENDEPEELSNNMILRISKRVVGAVDQYDGDRFFTKVDGRRRPTPLLLCLVAIELSDFVFAVDSIPAVIGVSNDIMVVYSSNIFAIMGLRSLYTVVAAGLNDFVYLRHAVALVLAFISLKMVLEFFDFEISIAFSLGMVAAILVGGVVLSLVHSHRTTKSRPDPPDLHAHTDQTELSVLSRYTTGCLKGGESIWRRTWSEHRAACSLCAGSFVRWGIWGSAGDVDL